MSSSMTSLTGVHLDSHVLYVHVVRFDEMKWNASQMEFTVITISEI